MNEKPWLVALAVGTILDLATTLYAVQEHGVLVEANPWSRSLIAWSPLAYAVSKIALSVALAVVLVKGYVLVLGRIAIVVVCSTALSNCFVIYLRATA